MRFVEIETEVSEHNPELLPPISRLELPQQVPAHLILLKYDGPIVKRSGGENIMSATRTHNDRERGSFDVSLLENR